MLCFYLKYSTILSTLKITDTQNLGHQIVFAKPNMANIIILFCLILVFLVIKKNHLSNLFLIIFISEPKIERLQMKEQTRHTI